MPDITAHREVDRISASRGMRVLLATLLTRWRIDNPEYQDIGLAGYLKYVAYELHHAPDPVLLLVADELLEGETGRMWRCRPDISALRELAVAAMEIRPALRRLRIDATTYEEPEPARRRRRRRIILDD